MMEIKPGDQFQGLFSNLIHTVDKLSPGEIAVTVQDHINLVSYKVKTKEQLLKYKRKIDKNGKPI